VLLQWRPRELAIAQEPSLTSQRPWRQSR
jgi:hypothetical protein